MQEIYEKIEEADMILIGLGEEFDDVNFLKNIAHYQEGKDWLKENQMLWLLPAYDEYFREHKSDHNQQIKLALEKLAELIKEKNYFVVTTAFNEAIEKVSFKEGRVVRPCGGSKKTQCSCGGSLRELTEQQKNTVKNYIEVLISGEKPMEELELGICPKCNKPYSFNNIYAADYDEQGYLTQWQIYTKWLQGSLNKKLLILELGEGMRFPTVIRFPFEKIAYFNQKAEFYRINEKLYQMSEELKEKGISISKNSIDWLQGMC
ncbi:MAG: hypothetical protein IJF07_06710 [Lachnospiraceae bacterium]|nr:hypothetical protein [Lachnospiraceae bacterium]